MPVLVLSVMALSRRIVRSITRARRAVLACSRSVCRSRSSSRSQRPSVSANATAAAQRSWSFSPFISDRLRCYLPPPPWRARERGLCWVTHIIRYARAGRCSGAVSVCVCVCGSWLSDRGGTVRCGTAHAASASRAAAAASAFVAAGAAAAACCALCALAALAACCLLLLEVRTALELVCFWSWCSSPSCGSR